MISNISKKITTKLIVNNSVSEDERELYEYGLFLLVSNAFYFSVTIGIGIICRQLFQSIVFFIVFCAIRQYAGGYHAKTELRCEISTISSIVLSIFTMMVIEHFNLKSPLILITTILAVIIFIFAPIDTDEKKLTKKELDLFCKKSKIIIVITYIIILISLFLNFSSIFIPCSISIILEGLLLIAGKLKKTKATNE